MGKIAIVDYQIGNLFSVNQALQNIGLETVISSDPDEISQADALVLPGMGAFKDAMSNLKAMDLEGPIKDFIQSGKPFLGICLGLQLLFTESEEFGSSKGLDIIPGQVKRFNNHNEGDDKLLRVPQIGWNKIFPTTRIWNQTPLQELSEGEFMYFVHSYYVVPDGDELSITKTTYGPVNYTSGILKNNIFACQFHPEKSAEKGLSIYKQWALSNKLLNSNG